MIHFTGSEIVITYFTALCNSDVASPGILRNYGQTVCLCVWWAAVMSGLISLVFPRSVLHINTTHMVSTGGRAFSPDRAGCEQAKKLAHAQASWKQNSRRGSKRSCKRATAEAQTGQTCNQLGWPDRNASTKRRRQAAFGSIVQGCVHTHPRNAAWPGENRDFTWLLACDYKTAMLASRVDFRLMIFPVPAHTVFAYKKRGLIKWACHLMILAVPAQCCTYSFCKQKTIYH